MYQVFKRMQPAVEDVILAVWLSVHPVSPELHRPCRVCCPTLLWFGSPPTLHVLPPQAPESLLESLETHLNTLEGKKP